ncbi:MAG TPA: serine/threonine protein kinase [Candidatus Aphodovivens avicola]|nr:serine/threonine protein kinase [Candidatus Aphodovivens avicola]
MARNQLILDRYAPLAEAGTGGFSTVQVAWDTRIQRKVAIKCIELEELRAPSARRGAPRDLSSQETVSLGGLDVTGDVPSVTSVDVTEGTSPVTSPAAPTRLIDEGGAPTRALGERDDYSAAVRAYLRVPGLDEARTAAMLSDADIVAVYDFEVRGSTAYLIMEYVEGMTLTQLLEECGDQLTLEIVAAVFSSVAHALDVAHENQVLHLDIKPDNILIDRKGQVKVTDFGLAKLAGAGGFGSAGGGTIGYMPLEQMRGELLDVRCDEWALASVSYEMLTGENPFLAEDLRQAEAAIEGAELVLPSLCWDDLDDQIDDVLFYALDPDREERYDTVADFAEEMEKFLGDPKRGRRELARLVSDARSDDEGEWDEAPEPERPVERAPLGERVGALPRAIAGRAVALAGSALVAGLGLSNLPGASGVDNPLFWGLLALVGALGAALPHAGALAAYAVLAAALIAQGAPAAGCLLVAAAGAWWWFVGREGTAQANCALAGPLAGAVGAAALAPLAAGAALRPVQALATGAFSALSAFVLAALGSKSLFGWDALATWRFAGVDIQGNLIDLAVDPAVWAVVAGWVASAALLSALCLRRSRALLIVGVVAGAAILVVAACAAAGLSAHQALAAPAPEAFASILVSAIAVAVVASAFPKQEGPLDDAEEPFAEQGF